MSGIFSHCESLPYLHDISEWDTKNVTNIIFMFNNCKTLWFLPDVSKWNINKFTIMN